MKSRLTGLIAAPFTPMKADTSLNLELIPRQVESLAASGVNGAFICGTTGEGMSLSMDERLLVTETWMRSAPRQLRVIVHVGHHTVAVSRTLAAHAEKLNAAAFATIGPTFFRATNVEQLVDYCAQVATGAPGLPFYYYHMPAMTGVELSMYDFLKLASPRIPNLAGIKFTHENLMEYSRCLNFDDGRFNILFGRDEVLLAALAMGAIGAVGSTYNYMPALYHRVIQAFEAGDMETARKYQSQAIQVIAIMSRRGGLAAGKAMMKLVGLDCGPVRAPLQNLSAEAFESLTRELERVGFPDQINGTTKPAASPLETAGGR